MAKTQKKIRDGLYGNVNHGKPVTFGSGRHRTRGRYVLEVRGEVWRWLYPSGAREPIISEYRNNYESYIRTGGWKRFSSNPFTPKRRVTQSHTVISQGFKVSNLLAALQHCDPEAIVLIPSMSQHLPMTDLKDNREAKTVVFSH